MKHFNLITNGLRPLLHTRNTVAARMGRWHPPSSSHVSQFGKDYPRLPWSSFDTRNPYAKWDDPVHRRNFGETIHEEYDVQDAFFQGEHEPWKNFIKGLQGQLIVAAIFSAFFGAAVLTYDADSKPPPRELPHEVTEYLATAGWDRVKSRPYEPVLTVPCVTNMASDANIAAGKSDKTSSHHE